jgi:thiamine transporter 2/3
VPQEHYKKVTSYTYTAALIGKFFAGTCGQFLISYKLANFHQLNYVSLTCVSSALVLSLFLPTVKQSIYFNRKYVDPITSSNSNEKYESVPSASTSASSSKTTTRESSECHDATTTSVTCCHKYMKRLRGAGPILWQDFKDAYSNSYILKWSIFWALGTAGNYQIINYTQALWESIENYHKTQIYNGAVATIQCLLSECQNSESEMIRQYLQIFTSCLQVHLLRWLLDTFKSNGEYGVNRCYV